MTFLAKIFGLTIHDISDCPFTPDHIQGKKVLVIHGNKAICG